jgi:hypothetical protein
MSLFGAHFSTATGVDASLTVMPGGRQPERDAEHAPRGRGIRPV